MANRQLAAIMFTDMVGYTALMQENEQLALEKRRSNKAIFDDCLRKYNGNLLQQYGDGTLSINASAVNAIFSAIEMQTQCQKENINLRIGIHIGEILTDENGIYGDSVNIASRIESLAITGSVFISEKLYDEVKNQQNISTKPLGYYELKNVNQPMQVYAITNPGMIIPSRDEVRGKIKQTMNSIAVLPFSSMSADPENEYFCDGLSEELINVLSKVDGIRISSRTSSFAFKGKQEDIREIAGRLNVQNIIEGSVRKSGNKVRITVQLINAADGYHIWSESYDRSLEDIFEVQDDISRTIANKLRKNLSSSDHEKPLVSVPTENIEAYKKYMQGMHYRGIQRKEAAMKSMQCFYEAVALEPEFVNPYFNIVELNAFFSDVGIISIEEAARICGEASSKAMQIDPKNAWSLLTAGINAFYFEWDMEKAEHYLEQAIELNHNLLMAHLFLARLHLVMLKKDKIEESLRSAYQLDPVGDMTLGGAAELSFLAGKFELAIEYCNEALDIEPHNGYAAAFKAFVIGFQGDWDTAIEILEPIYKEAPDFNYAIAFIGYAYAKSGQTDKARDFISILEEIQKIPNSPRLHHFLAILYLALGEKEKFYENYEVSMKMKSNISLQFYPSPMLAEVRGEERLIKLRKEFGLPV
ncbi:MAG TPA: adenylate/guanylate cyclase domain-containing protein [Saprospiraceae bacterium]|nr:adenylate/guanylate cyclase domain-containing protein [Saprospiraceae bacterium]